MTQYVYQLAIRKPNDEIEKITIESDIIFADKKLTKKNAEDISKKHSCDVRLTYLGKLTKTNNENDIIDISYYTKDDINAIIEEWKKPKEKEVTV